jgi:hypothetical protein
MLATLYWPVAVALMAIGQGLLLPAVRRTPPGTEAKRQAFGLHGLLLAAYFLPLALAPSLLGVGVAIGCRLLLFDPVLNLAAGYPPFAVGQTAVSDRALQWLAQRLNMESTHLRGLLWLFCLVLTACLVLLVK